MQPEEHVHFKAHQGAALTFPFTSLPQAAVATWAWRIWALRATEMAPVV